MGIWIEIHCDGQGYGCQSHSADIYGELCPNTLVDISRAMVYLRDTAKKNGWKYRNGKWFCPNCRT